MARLFPTISNPSHHYHHHLPFSSTNFSFLISSIAVLSIFALVIFLCTSSRKSNKSNRMQRRNFVSKMNSNISSRAISMTKMISWRKVEAGDELDEEERGGGSCDLSGDDDDDEEEEVWRKTIIRGERCRPLKFSGKIDYDSDGNLLCDSNREFK